MVLHFCTPALCCTLSRLDRPKDVSGPDENLLTTSACLASACAWDRSRHPRARACVCVLSINRPKDVWGCPAAPEEPSFTPFLALFLLAHACVCLSGSSRADLASCWTICVRRDPIPRSIDPQWCVPLGTGGKDSRPHRRDRLMWDPAHHQRGPQRLHGSHVRRLLRRDVPHGICGLSDGDMRLRRALDVRRILHERCSSCHSHLGVRMQCDRRLEEVAKAVGGGYCRLQMPWKLALAVREAVAGRWLGALKGEEGVPPPPFQCLPGPRTTDRFCSIGKGTRRASRCCQSSGE